MYHLELCLCFFFFLVIVRKSIIIFNESSTTRIISETGCTTEIHLFIRNYSFSGENMVSKPTNEDEEKAFRGQWAQS